MSLRNRHSEENIATEINISPLLDVIFILLIFFIVTMVFADHEATKVDLPQAENVSTVNTDAAIVVISENGEVFIDDKSYSVSQIKIPLSKNLEKSNGVLIIKLWVSVVDFGVSFGAVAVSVDFVVGLETGSSGLEVAFGASTGVEVFGSSTTGCEVGASV